MAEQAQKEPTMEEILASIKRIISEDETSSSRTGAGLEPIPAQDPPSRDELTPEDVSVRKTPSDDEMFDEVELSTAPQEAASAEPVRFSEDFDADNDEFYEDFSSGEDLPPPPKLDEIAAALSASSDSPGDDAFNHEPEETLRAETAPASSDMTEPASGLDDSKAPAPMEMPRRSQMRDDTLTENTTADAAAGSLARLVSRMDLGSDMTLEGLVRELLRPMIKEWLDANLPNIVEEKVEAEVQRISRLAR